MENGTRWQPYVRHRLDALDAGDGKDHWEGGWPSHAVVLAARQVADELFLPDTPTPSVVPSEDSHVLFLWRKHGWDIEIEVDQESHAEMWARDRILGTELTGSLEELSPRKALRELLQELAKD